VRAFGKRLNDFNIGLNLATFAFTGRVVCFVLFVMCLIVALMPDSPPEVI
jgi:hypothetical protein